MLKLFHYQLASIFYEFRISRGVFLWLLSLLSAEAMDTGFDSNNRHACFLAAIQELFGML